MPGFKPLAAGYSINELGNWLGDIALAVLVYERTGSALATALVFTATRFVPALAAPAIVARVERLQARASLPLLYGLDAVVFAVLAVLAKHFSLAPVVILGALDGSFALAARALTRATSAALLNPHGLLRRGNALFNFGFTAAGAVGPAIGGLITAGAGPSTALALDAGSFALVAVVLGMARALPRAERAAGEWAARVRQAIAYVRERRLLAGLIAAQGAASLFFFAIVPIEIVYAKTTLHAGISGYGWLLASWGGGMLVGGLLFAAAHRVRIETVLALGTAAIGCAYLGLSAAPNIGVACAVSVVGGIGNGVQWVSLVSAVQELTASTMQARVVVLVEAINAAVPGIAFFAGGGLTALTSPRTAYAAAGGGVVVVLLIAGFLLRDAPWPGRARVGPEESAAAVGHGPVP